MAAGKQLVAPSATGSGAAPEGAPLPPFFPLGDRLLDLVDHALIVLRGAVRLDEADHAVDLLGGDEAALHAAGLALAERGVEHIAAADELFRAGGIENDAGFERGRDREGDSAGDVRLNQTRNDVHRRALRCNDQVHSGGAAHLRHAADGLLDLPSPRRA